MPSRSFYGWKMLAALWVIVCINLAVPGYPVTNQQSAISSRLRFRNLYVLLGEIPNRHFTRLSRQVFAAPGSLSHSQDFPFGGIVNLLNYNAILSPPSIGRNAPTIYFAFSETRKATASPTSSGIPMCPIGIRKFS
jgi:hypothetical protein